MKLRTLIFAILALIPSATLMAAGNGKADYIIWGFVRDNEGNLLPHADVYSSDKLYQTMSDEQGRYKLIIPRDSVTIVYSYVGFQTYSNHFRRYGNMKMFARHDVMFEPEITEIEDVTVLGSVVQYTTAERVNISTLNVTPSAAGGGIEGLIKTFQGVSSTNELSSQYSVRGGSYDENSVYVNGIEVYRPYLVRTGEQEGLSFVNPDLVGEVNFSAGGFDARYGDKLSSVLDIKYRKPKKFEAGVMGNLYGATGYIGQSTSKFSQLHGIRYKNNALMLKTMPTQAEYNPNFIDYQTYITYRPIEPVEISFLGNFSQNIYNFKPQTRSTTFGPLGMMKNFTVYFSGQEQDLFRTIFGAFSVKYSPTKRTDLNWTVSVFNTEEHVTYDIEGEYWLSDVVDNSGTTGDVTGVGNYYEHARNRMSSLVIRAQHDGAFKITPENTLTWGFGSASEFVNERTKEWEMRDSSGYSIPYTPKETNLYYSLTSNNELNATRTYAYIQDSHRWDFQKGGVLALTAGVRANYWGFNNEFTASPRVSLAYFPDIKPDIRFRLASGMYYQQPSYKEIKDTVSVNGNLQYYLNHDIRSQRSIQVVFGMDYFYHFMRHPFKLTFEAYYKNLTNIITYNLDNVSVRYTGKNNAHGYVAGFDVKLFGEFVPGADSWISFSMMRAMEDVDGDGHGYIPRPTDQLFNISIFFQDYIPRLPQYRIHLLMSFAQGFPTGPSRGTRYEASRFRAPTYRRVDLGFSRVCEKGKDAWMGKGFFKPFQRIIITLECLNLFGFNNVNSYYWVTDIYNNQYGVPNYLTGRQFNFKLRMDF